MKLKIQDIQGNSQGELEVKFPLIVNGKGTQAVHDTVVAYNAAQRSGTACTKNVGEVAGTNKKPWKQKGTGRARVGSIRSPIWRHGGITFGPRANQNWELKINKSAKRQALFMGLSDKVKEKQFIIVDQITLEQPKTKDFAKVLAALSSGVKTLGKKQILLMPKKDDKLFRSSRNIPSIIPMLANSLNIVDVLTADSLVVLRDSLPVIEKTFLKSK